MHSVNTFLQWAIAPLPLSRRPRLSPQFFAPVQTASKTQPDTYQSTSPKRSYRHPNPCSGRSSVNGRARPAAHWAEPPTRRQAHPGPPWPPTSSATGSPSAPAADGSPSGRRQDGGPRRRARSAQDRGEQAARRHLPRPAGGTPGSGRGVRPRFTRRPAGARCRCATSAPPPWDSRPLPLAARHQVGASASPKAIGVAQGGGDHSCVQPAPLAFAQLHRSAGARSPVENSPATRAGAVASGFVDDEAHACGQPWCD